MEASQDFYIYLRTPYPVNVVAPSKTGEGGIKIDDVEASRALRIILSKTYMTYLFVFSDDRARLL